jgi:uncharacterized protein
MELENNRKIIFRCKVGSHLYGLNRPESDIDYFTVFMPEPEDILGMQKMEIVDNSTKNSAEERRNTSEDTDDVAYSLPKFLALVVDNNPNIVEVLFAKPEVIEVCDPIFKYLMDNSDKIISQKAKHTFSGYAHAQKQKLVTKRDRFNSLGAAVPLFEKWLEKDLIEGTVKLPREASLHGFLQATFESDVPPIWREITEEESEELNKTLKYYKGERHHTESFHKGMHLGMIYKKIRIEYEKYGWRVHTDSFEKLGFDLKFAYHLIRLMAEGVEILETGRLSYPIKGQARADIIKVRNGEIEFDQLMEMYESYKVLMEKAAEETKLPHKPDWNWANKWLISVLRQYIIDHRRDV